MAYHPVMRTDRQRCMQYEPPDARHYSTRLQPSQCARPGIMRWKSNCLHTFVHKAYIACGHLNHLTDMHTSELANELSNEPLGASHEGAAFVQVDSEYCKVHDLSLRPPVGWSRKGQVGRFRIYYTKKTKSPHFLPSDSAPFRPFTTCH